MDETVCRNVNWVSTILPEVILRGPIDKPFLELFNSGEELISSKDLIRQGHKLKVEEVINRGIGKLFRFCDGLPQLVHVIEDDATQLRNWCQHVIPKHKEQQVLLDVLRLSLCQKELKIELKDRSQKNHVRSIPSTNIL